MCLVLVSYCLTVFNIINYKNSFRLPKNNSLNLSAVLIERCKELAFEKYLNNGSFSQKNVLIKGVKDDSDLFCIYFFFFIYNIDVAQSMKYIINRILFQK